MSRPPLSRLSTVVALLLTVQLGVLVSTTTLMPSIKGELKHADIKGSLVQADSMGDLMRVAAIQQLDKAQKQHKLIDTDTSATTLQESFAIQSQNGRLYNSPSVSHLMSRAPQMPAGMRRLDHIEAPKSALLDLPNVDPAAFLRPEILQAAAAANRISRGDQYRGIVDNGPGGRYPSAELMARLANDNYNRLAQASAIRFQQSVARNQMRSNEMALANQRRDMNQLASRNMQRGLGMMPMEGGQHGRRASLITSERRVSKPARDRGGGAGLKRATGGRLVGRSDYTEGDEDEEDETEEGTGERAKLSRRNSDPIFGDLDSNTKDEELEALDRVGESGDDSDSGGATTDETTTAAADSERDRALARHPGGSSLELRGVPRRGQLSRGAGRRAGQAAAAAWNGKERLRMRSSGGNDMVDNDDDSDDSDESKENSGDNIESMNSRIRLESLSVSATTAGRESSGGVNYSDNNQIARPQRPESGRQVRHERGGRRQQEPSSRLAVQQQYVDFRAAQNGRDGEDDSNANLNNETDSDLSASHVRQSATDLQTAAGHHHKHHGHYYQFVEVPKKKAWKFGFKRGNHKHEIEKHEKGHKNKFHTEFKWHAKEKCKKKSKCKSVGKMTWDYKHHDKKHHG